MIDELLLLSGNDIPFPLCGITIHQPKIKQIAYITEDYFWSGCEFLKFDKEILIDEDKNDLSNMSNFNIIMTIMQEKNIESQKARINVLYVLTLLFPKCQVLLKKDAIQLKDQQTGEIHSIKQNDFESFKTILIEMFCLNGDNKQYTPSGELAKKIVNKIKQGRDKKAKLAPENQKITILSRYASILAVGEKKDLNDLMNYTVYQLMDQFKRFNLKMQYDIYLQLKCAGATGMNEPDDWLDDIHNNRTKEN